VGRIELPSPAWKAGVIAFIRHSLLITPTVSIGQIVLLGGC
jgi:hypothetical protein